MVRKQHEGWSSGSLAREQLAEVGVFGDYDESVVPSKGQHQQVRLALETMLANVFARPCRQRA